MTWARMIRVALWAYPRGGRPAGDEEIITTVLDASGGSPVRFAREIRSLVFAGMRARGMETAGAGAPRLIADGMCLAGVAALILDLAVALSQRHGGLESPLLAEAWVISLAAILLVALAGLDRVAGVAALAWTGLRIPDLAAEHVAARGFASALVVWACFGAMVLTPRHRDGRRGVAWLGVPRLAVACGVLVTGLGISIAAFPTASMSVVVPAVAAAPLAFVGVAVRTHRLQHRTHL